jgi:hypothetical protein
MRFFHSPGGVSPRSPDIADGVPCCSLGLAVPRIDLRTPRRIPPACSWIALQQPFGPCHHVPCLLGLCSSLRSATFPMNPFPASPLLSYRRDVVPRGFTPRAGPYHQTPVKVPVGLPSLGLVPLRSFLHASPCHPHAKRAQPRIDRVPMMPCITVAPRLRTAAFVFVPAFR